MLHRLAARLSSRAEMVGAVRQVSPSAPRNISQFSAHRVSFHIIIVIGGKFTYTPDVPWSPVYIDV